MAGPMESVSQAAACCLPVPGPVLGVAEVAVALALPAFLEHHLTKTLGAGAGPISQVRERLHVVLLF